MLTTKPNWLKFYGLITSMVCCYLTRILAELIKPVGLILWRKQTSSFAHRVSSFPYATMRSRRWQSALSP